MQKSLPATAFWLSGMDCQLFSLPLEFETHSNNFLLFRWICKYKCISPKRLIVILFSADNNSYFVSYMCITCIGSNQSASASLCKRERTICSDISWCKCNTVADIKYQDWRRVHLDSFSLSLALSRKIKYPIQNSKQMIPTLALPDMPPHGPSKRLSNKHNYG